ncbi:myeloperoxidase [Columba guinea]|nr:myeloperoxidase [Columba guinea]
MWKGWGCPDPNGGTWRGPEGEQKDLERHGTRTEELGGDGSLKEKSEGVKEGKRCVFVMKMSTENAFGKIREDSKVLSDSYLLSVISEARQLVDSEYLHAREREGTSWDFFMFSLKKKLVEKLANPMDFLKHLKDPVGRTRSAVRAADYLETTLQLLKEKLHLSGNCRFNVTDLLDRKQKEMIAKETGCDYQIHSIKCPEHDIYRTITGECNNRPQSLQLSKDSNVHDEGCFLAIISVSGGLKGCKTLASTSLFVSEMILCLLSSMRCSRKHSHLGSSNRAFARWLPAEYEDGVSVPRGATEGKLYNGFPLPLVRTAVLVQITVVEAALATSIRNKTVATATVRKVSNEIALTANENITQDQELSLVFMQWGQWVDHDIDLSPASGAGASPALHCETDCAFNSPCFPIKFPPDDPRMLRSNSCMPFVQSASVCNPGTFTREQINAITSFIDASTVYGSEDSMAKSLRNQTNQMGLMAVNQNFTDEGLELLPFENTTKSVCVLTNKSMNIPCFKAGDKRVTENLGLSALHTVFLREHNRLVRELSKLNPHWDGEKLYQETRKIVAAIIQIITYRDYLSVLLGKETSKWIPLYRGYNESVDPRISNVFTLAFRFGHASVKPFVSRLNDSFQPLGSFSHVPLHLTFCATWRIVMEGGIDPVIRGMVVDHAKLMKQNQMLIEELQNHLFEQTEIMGLDLAALNMQRGRDHGLPGYNAWRRFCGLSQPQNVDEFSKVLGNSKLAKKFMELYGTPENIDIWIGAISEPFVAQGRVGPLLACIIGTQFRNLRDGDRFWWENPGVFTPRQLRALRKISLSRVVCDNTHIKKIPRNVFKVNSYPEDFVDCREIEALNLSPWKDETESSTKGTLLSVV